MAAIGILGGTFNPPHIGHLLCAQEARDRLRLDRVVLMPVLRPPHKEVPEDPGTAERVELCRAAVAGDERFDVSTAEIDRAGDGPSFTVDTLRQWHRKGIAHALMTITGHRRFTLEEIERLMPRATEPEPQEA